MAKYPIFLEIGGRRVVVVGGGLVALRKVEGLLEAGARVVVVAKQTCGAMARLCQEQPVELVRDRYSKEYLGQAALVIAATNDPQLNQQIYNDCQRLQIWCNVVDRPELCDFFVPAVVRRGDLVVAIGTEGFCPAYASHLRKRLEEVITPLHGEFLKELETIRKLLQRLVADQTLRKGLLGQMVSDRSFGVFKEKGKVAWRRYARGLIRQVVGDEA
ncbi:MAG: bifunctional precorrin-2 dehydrogenase/sirohydrochlorin ferrochelatase [Sedimentisphaerales bacterium]|jgi:precorrin-2 dehydrogenase/sirohydrochlorin ferrochelatase|nr:bifunctional precorrin-2 dehydrogenase/sirohydrochlorin ferrochelatase [Sedimentisphaerales bacterium]